VGARARKATLFCPRCKTVLEVITDKQALSKYR
jgi:phage FluMu protein Com